MKPGNPSVKDPQSRLFEAELVDLIDLNHPLAQLTNRIPWDHLDEEFDVFMWRRQAVRGNRSGT